MSNVDTETQAPVETPQVPLNETPVDGPGSGRSEIRKQLEKSVAEVNKREQQPRERDSRRPNAKVTQSRARREAAEQETEAEPEVEATEAETETPEETEQQSAAPAGWSKEAKAVWEQLPPEVQTAVAKREADMSKGVEELKKKYADIDQALQPRMDTIRRHGHTPAQAVNQLFAWFDALSANPTVAFPALANSFKFDLRAIPGLAQQQTQPQPQTPQTPPQAPAQAQTPAQPVPASEIPQAMQAYVDELKQKITSLEQGFTNQLGQLSNSFAQQSQAKTEEILANWSKDKPYFEEVRRTMAQLIASHTVPPLPNGTADLDRAYDMAMYALPEVRAKVLADQQAAAEAARKAKLAAEKKAQQEAADKARRAAGSLSQGAPGATMVPPKKGAKGKSVRESIEEARAEIAER